MKIKDMSFITWGFMLLLSAVLLKKAEANTKCQSQGDIKILQKKVADLRDMLNSVICSVNKAITSNWKCNSPFIESPPFKDGKVYLHPKLAEEKKGNWFKNKRICEKYNAEMVSIHSEEENKYFYNWAKGSDVGMVHPGAWLAARTHNHDVNFTWDNVGVTRNYTNLSPAKFNEPGTNCLMMGWRHAAAGALAWDDWYCDRQLFIVCQKRLQNQFCQQKHP